MTPRRSIALLLMAIAGLGSITACGDDGGGGGSEDAASQQAGATSTSSATTTSGRTSARNDAPSSMEEWEDVWKDERANIVERIQDEGWGKSADGRMLPGPEGFTIDLSTGPTGWHDTEGTIATDAKIGFTLPQSGPAAEGGGIGYAQEALFAHYNAEKVFTDHG